MTADWAGEPPPFPAVLGAGGRALGPLHGLGGRLLLTGALMIGAAVVGWALNKLLGRAAKGRYGWALGPLQRTCRWPALIILVLATAYFSLPDASDRWLRGFRHGLTLVLVAAAAWVVVAALQVVEDAAFRRASDDAIRSRRGRRTRTQLRLMRRLLAVVVVVLAFGAILTSFAPMRILGASLLTSAGVVGVVIGLSARTVLGNAFSGIQLAIADTMHVDDVIVVEGNWGRVEEVKLTHVIVRLWDERALVLPTTYFTERAFQNWSRNETRVVGEISLFVDYTADLNVLRAEAHRIIGESPLWDRNQWAMKLVDVTPQGIQVQVLASAADGPSAWDLRCDLREGLLMFLRDQHPQWLPRTRNDYKP